MASETIPESWRTALGPVLASPAARKLGGWLKAEEAAGKQVYPPRGMRLAALALTPLDQVRCVILGQDPYHGPGQAHGLAFSVQDGVRVPPSLVNIYKELEADLGLPRAATGDLSPWARQGVLLLNNTLTVEAGQAGSHAGQGWDAITTPKALPTGSPGAASKAERAMAKPMSWVTRPPWTNIISVTCMRPSST